MWSFPGDIHFVFEAKTNKKPGGQIAGHAPERRDAVGAGAAGAPRRRPKTADTATCGTSAGTRPSSDAPCAWHRPGLTVVGVAANP